MTEKEINQLTDEELQQQWKKAKTANITIAVLIGVLVGTFVYAAVKKGFSFFTVFPLLLIPVFASTQKKYRAIEMEMKLRNLK